MKDKMMSTRQALNTSITADSPRGRQAVEIFRAQYNKANLNATKAQALIEHPGFAAYLATGIREYSRTPGGIHILTDITVGGKSKESLLSELIDAGVYVHFDAKEKIRYLPKNTNEATRVRFGHTKVRNLGFMMPPSFSAIFDKVESLGHSLCDVYDALYIRLDLVRAGPEAANERFVVLSRLCSGDWKFFVIEPGNPPILTTSMNLPNQHCNLDTEIVFRFGR